MVIYLLITKVNIDGEKEGGLRIPQGHLHQKKVRYEHSRTPQK